MSWALLLFVILSSQPLHAHTHNLLEIIVACHCLKLHLLNFHPHTISRKYSEIWELFFSTASVDCGLWLSLRNISYLLGKWFFSKFPSLLWAKSCAKINNAKEQREAPSVWPFFTYSLQMCLIMFPLSYRMLWEAEPVFLQVPDTSRGSNKYQPSLPVLDLMQTHNSYPCTARTHCKDNSGWLLWQNIDFT